MNNGLWVFWNTLQDVIDWNVRFGFVEYDYS